jgi:DNA-binding CsgD family transcriptional regulator
VWEHRADAARREIAALATDGSGVADLHAAALGIVHRHVPFQRSCWGSVDPETMMLTSVTNWPPWPVSKDIAVRYSEIECAGTDPHPYGQLARRAVPVARMSDAPHRDVVRSVRLNDLLRPEGLEHELRTAFRIDNACWAVGGLFREAGSDFSDREVEFLASLAHTLAAATRIAVRVHAHGRRDDDGPVIVLVGARGEIRAATPAAAEWLSQVEDAAPGRLSMTLYAVVAGSRAATSGTARARMRDLDGGWVVVQASRLITGDDPEQTVVTVQCAAADDRVRLMLAAYGASARERDVCLELLDGRSTTQIAQRLFISPHTVQDHLKSLFDKVGVRSRGQLLARLQA